MPMSPYVRALRAKIGTDLLEVPTVSVVVIDATGSASCSSVTSKAICGRRPAA